MTVDSSLFSSARDCGIRSVKYLGFAVPYQPLLSAIGRRSPRDAPVGGSDRSAVRTPGGPDPGQGGLGQRLCRTPRYPGKAGAGILLGTSQLGADLNIPPQHLPGELDPDEPKFSTATPSPPTPPTPPTPPKSWSDSKELKH